jgi:hypothetical protein
LGSLDAANARGSLSEIGVALAAGLWAAFDEARERRDFALGYAVKYQHFALNLPQSIR